MENHKEIMKAYIIRHLLFLLTLCLPTYIQAAVIHGFSNSQDTISNASLYRGEFVRIMSKVDTTSALM